MVNRYGVYFGSLSCAHLLCATIYFVKVQNVDLLLIECRHKSFQQHFITLPIRFAPEGLLDCRCCIWVVFEGGFWGEDFIQLTIWAQFFSQKCAIQSHSATSASISKRICAVVDSINGGRNQFIPCFHRPNHCRQARFILFSCLKKSSPKVQ